MKTWAYYIEAVRERLAELETEKENKTSRYLNRHWIFDHNIEINKEMLKELMKRSNLQ